MPEDLLTTSEPCPIFISVIKQLQAASIEICLVDLVLVGFFVCLIGWLVLFGFF